MPAAQPAIPHFIVSLQVKIEKPIMRIPMLAIHLNRDISTKGFEMNKQTHLVPILASAVQKAANKPTAPAPNGSSSTEADGQNKRQKVDGAGDAADLTPKTAKVTSLCSLKHLCFLHTLQVEEHRHEKCVYTPEYASCNDVPVVRLSRVCLQFEEKHHSRLLQLVADQLECSVSDIVDFELNVCDTQDGVIGGSSSHCNCLSMHIPKLLHANFALSDSSRMDCHLVCFPGPVPYIVCVPMSRHGHRNCYNWCKASYITGQMVPSGNYSSGESSDTSVCSSHESMYSAVAMVTAVVQL